jgi:hypothetical protein
MGYRLDKVAEGCRRLQRLDTSGSVNCHQREFDRSFLVLPLIFPSGRAAPRPESFSGAPRSRISCLIALCRRLGPSVFGFRIFVFIPDP